jgi:hypothetical protein
MLNWLGKAVLWRLVFLLPALCLIYLAATRENWIFWIMIACGYLVAALWLLNTPAMQKWLKRPK